MRKVERQLRERVKHLEEAVKQVSADRDKFREYFIGKLKWWIDLHGSGKTPSLPWLIEDAAKFLTRVERWWW